MAVVVSWYLRALRIHPWKTQSLTAGVLMTAGDVICQTIIEKKKPVEIEKKRTLRFTILGSCYVGPVLQTWYRQLERIFGTSGRTVGLKKMLLDQFGFAPCFILVFLTANNVLRNHSWEVIKKDLEKNYMPILKANYVVWPATQLVTFYVVPLHLRVVFVNSVALLWNTYLAWKAN